jgi:hypothetical protein
VLCGLLAGCGRAQKIEAGALDHVRRVAVIDNVADDLVVARMNRVVGSNGDYPGHSLWMHGFFGADIDIAARKNLEATLAPQYEIVPVAIDYPAMQQAQRRFYSAAEARQGGAFHAPIDDIVGNAAVLAAGLPATPASAIDAYVYIYRSNNSRCKMYGTEGGWTGHGLTLFAYHDWLVADKYLLSANLGAIIFNANLQPIGQPATVCSWLQVDKSYWIGPSFEQPVPQNLDKRNIDPARIDLLRQAFAARMQDASLEVLRAVGFLRQ